MICNTSISKRAPSCKLGQDGWSDFRSAAEKWDDIALPENHVYFPYARVKSLVESKPNAFGTVHRSCRSNFTSKSLREKIENKHGKKSELVIEEVENPTDNDAFIAAAMSPVKERLRSSIGSVEANLCFICNQETEKDHLLYSDGGIARCSRDTAGKRLEKHKDRYLKGDKTHIYYEAARRLDMKIKGKASDIWAADIFTHKKCYIGFAFPYEHVVQEEMDEAEALALNTFYFNVRQKIIKEKCAFTLSDLFKDIQSISEEMNLETPVISSKRTLQRRLNEQFGETIEFNVPHAGGPTIVYSAHTNPCDYAVAALHGCGLRDDDFVKAFGKLVKQKVESKSEKRWPLTPEELKEELRRGPPKVLYNAVYATLQETFKKNSYGYFATDSQLLATKIWSIASDWESLITKDMTGKQACLGLIIHRDTASKSGINYLHKCNHSLSYNAIRLQNEAWARMITDKSYCASSFRKGVTTHSTMDNNDGKQETIDGTGTTHDTNITMFQLPTEEEMLLPTIGHQQTIPEKLSSTLEEEYTVKPYFIGKLAGPPKFDLLADDEPSSDELQYCLKRDIAWAAAGALVADENGDASYDPLGSWTAFLRQTTSSVPIKCIQEYQPVWPHPPEYPICKKYLDSIIELINDLELSHMFVHADELVYSKLCHILWKNPDMYKKIIVLMGGFHQLRVMQKILYKRYDCRKMQEICVEAEIIAKGSANQAFEGRHYYRCLRVHKECFDAFVQLRIEGLTDDYSSTSADLLALLRALRRAPSCDSLNNVMESPEFNQLCGEVLHFAVGTEGHFSVQYLKDVSLILALVSAVREGNFERHRQAEKNMAGLCFAFDHPNYARYVSYQHAYLSKLKVDNREAYDELVQKGFGASITGKPFSSIHGDLVTEYFNRTTKGTSGPFRAGYSRDTGAVNRWVKTIHIHSKLKEDFKNLLYLQTSSKHKEMTTGSKLMHQKHVQKIKLRIKHLGIDPFACTPPVSFATGMEIQPDVVKDMLRANEVGDAKLNQFTKERLVDRVKGFFVSIPKTYLKTGIVKKQNKPRAAEVIKEDKQAYGLLVGKAVSKEEAFSHPLTSFPLSIATTEGDLYQGDKHDWRNYLIQLSSSVTTENPIHCAWFFDGMAGVRTLSACSTYKAFANSLISFMSSLTEGCHPTVIGLINDCYLDDSTKNSTRAGRGKAGMNVRISSINQAMLTGMRWKEFLHNSKNKEALISIISRYFQSEEMRPNLPFPMIVNDKYDTVRINSDGVSYMFECNHEEADYRLVLHALVCEQDVVVVAKDTDVLVLLIWAYVHFNVNYKWYLMYEKGVYADISVICQYFGDVLCESILSFHAITGCDTTSYMYRIGKVRVFQKLMKNSDLCALMKNLENENPLTDDEIGDLKRFVQTVMYSGGKSESYVETRARLYDQQKNKTSTNIPPDPDSLLQDLKRKQLQVKVWNQLDKITMTIYDQKLYGWKLREEDGMMVPEWFTGNQFPPSLQRNARGKKRSNSSSETQPSKRRPARDISDGELADAELTDVNDDLPTVEYAIPEQVISYEPVTENENDGDDENDEDGTQRESSDTEMSDTNSSNDSGSDYEWAP